MQVIRLKTIRRTVTVLKKVLEELYVLRSEAWEVVTDLIRIAFGTPMFSQRPDRGYPYMLQATDFAQPPSQ
jgi:hypothetical protein